MKSDSGAWDALGRSVARRLGDGPDEQRCARQREAVAALVAQPPRRRAVPFAVAAAAAAVVVAVASGWWLTHRDDRVTFWVGEERVTGSEGVWIEADGQRGEPVRFEDGSRVDVHPGALLQISRAREDRVGLLLDHGKVTAGVRPERGSRWSIKAGPYTVRVTGTRFSVTWDPDRGAIEVEVEKGRVGVQGPGLDGKGTTLGQGDLLRMASGPQPPGQPAQAAGEPEPSPAVAPASPEEPPPSPRPAHAVQGVAPWKKLAAEGRYEQAVAAARKVGFEKLTRTLGKGDLWELARAARFAREGELAVTALEAYRDRFAETARAGTAAFLLGRVEMEQNESPAAAARWFRTYLAEQPDGPLAEEALGRLMDAQRKAGQEAAAKKSAQVYLSKHPEGIFKDLAESLLSH